MRNVLLLGGSGFLGNALLSKLSEENFKLKTMIHLTKIPKSISSFQGNILKKKSLEKKIENRDIVINLVGQYHGNLSKFIDLNIKGGLNLLESSLKKKNVRIILISTINVYGENLKKPSKESDDLLPQNSYGLIKKLIEKMYQNYALQFGLNITILRLSNLYGPNKKIGFIGNIINSIKKNHKIILNHNGTQYRDFVYVDDVVDGIINAIKKNKKGFHLYNISSGKRYMLKDIVKKIANISQTKPKIIFSSSAPDERCIWADNSKAARVLGFKPQITIEEGLKRLIK